MDGSLKIIIAVSLIAVLLIVFIIFYLLQKKAKRDYYGIKHSNYVFYLYSDMDCSSLISYLQSQDCIVYSSSDTDITDVIPVTHIVCCCSNDLDSLVFAESFLKKFHFSNILCCYNDSAYESKFKSLGIRSVKMEDFSPNNVLSYF